jgi:DNA polymerase I-like protein with 3'-5' exonuclease and polymerase domains
MNPRNLNRAAIRGDSKLNSLKDITRAGYITMLNESKGISLIQYTNRIEATRPALRSLYRNLQSNIKSLNILYRIAPSSFTMAADIETTGLNPRKDRIRLIGYAGADVGCYENPESLKDRLADPMTAKVFHNAPFDVTFLHLKGSPVVNYEDTMLMDQILTNNQGWHRLEDCCKKYLGAELDKTLQKPEHWQGSISAQHKAYCQKDCEMTLTLYRLLRDELEQKKLLNVYRRELRALPAIIRLQIDGMPFDAVAWRQELQSIKAQRDEVYNEFCMVEKSLINLGSPKQLKDFFWVHYGTELESTDDETLALLESTYPCIIKIRRWRELSKLISSFGEELIQKTVNGRLYPSWRLIGATTGRMSCKEPNLQQVPRPLRKYFKASSGHCLVIADYSQIELRIVAELAGEKIMLEAYRNGGDLHTLTAQMITGKSSITKDERQVAKACNFGLIYGMGGKGLQTYAKTSYGVDMSDAEAETFRDAFFRRYVGIKTWQERQQRASEIRTMGGRVWRDIPDKQYRNRFNYPVQGTGAEGLKESMALIAHSLPDEWKLCAIVHDEIVLEVPETDAELARAYLTACMKTGMERLLKVVPVEVDCKINDRWEK